MNTTHSLPRTISPHLAQATVEDFDTVCGLIEDAAIWLKEKKQLRQWQEPWPDRETRDQRIWDALKADATWIEYDDLKPVATVTVSETGDPKLWRPEELADKAVYAHRLVVDRDYAGFGLGAELMKWAGEHGRKHWNATCIRIDVWTDNRELQRYYKRQGFHLVRNDRSGYGEKTIYPAEALMEKDLTERGGSNI